MFVSLSVGASFVSQLNSAAIGMAMYIHTLQRRKCPENAPGGSDQLPFGYKRAEVIGGLINSVALVSLSAYVSVLLGGAPSKNILLFLVVPSF